MFCFYILFSSADFMGHDYRNYTTIAIHLQYDGTPDTRISLVETHLNRRAVAVLYLFKYVHKFCNANVPVDTHDNIDDSETGERTR